MPNGHHVLREGKTKWIAKGAIGGALEFAGNGDYLQTPILDELKSPKNFTLSAWFQTNDTAEDEHHIIWVDEGGQNGWGGGSGLYLSVRHFSMSDFCSHVINSKYQIFSLISNTCKSFSFLYDSNFSRSKFDLFNLPRE